MYKINKNSISDVANAIVDIEWGNQVGTLYLSDEEEIKLVIGGLMTTLCNKDEFQEELGTQEIVKGGSFTFDGINFDVTHVEGDTVKEEFQFWERTEMEEGD